MKKFLVLLFIISCQAHYGQIKSLDITYGCSFNVLPDDRFVNMEKVKSDLPDMYEEELRADSLVNFLEFKLLYKNNESLSYGIKPKSKDVQKLYFDFEGSDTIFTSTKTKEILIYKHDFWLTNLMLSHHYDQHNWNISDETKLIDNMICFKATTSFIEENSHQKREYKVIAWFNPQINIPIGPKGFGGLPGLIMELAVGFDVYYVKEIKFNTLTDNIKFQKNRKKTKSMTLDHFRVHYDEIRQEIKQMVLEGKM
jgi:GLPGLI family protein